MAPIGSTNNTQPPTAGAASPSSNTTVNKNIFLQLLVAQLRNQDPMSPSDGTQFIGQLAQFQQLEQSVNSGQDLAAIRTDLDALAAASLKTAQGTSKS
jgi:flagellar basal-body rod modification protein FlgD